MLLRITPQNGLLLTDIKSKMSSASDPLQKSQDILVFNMYLFRTCVCSYINERHVLIGKRLIFDIDSICEEIKKPLRSPHTIIYSLLYVIHGYAYVKKATKHYKFIAQDYRCHGNRDQRRKKAKYLRLSQLERFTSMYKDRYQR